MASNCLAQRICFLLLCDITTVEYELIWTYKFSNIILDFKIFLFEKLLRFELLGKCLKSLKRDVRQNYNEQLSSCIAEDTLHLHYKHQSISIV
jgi:hypothetical protein